MRKYNQPRVTGFPFWEVWGSLLPCILFMGTPLFASNPTTDVPITQPVYFSGDLLEASRKEGKVILQGNAFARHGETEIYAERIEIYYDTDGKTVKELVAHKQVRLVEPNRKGRAERAQYLPASRTLILEGSPTLWEGEDELKGRRILVYRQPDRVVVEGAQVKVTPERLRGLESTTTPATSP